MIFDIGGYYVVFPAELAFGVSNRARGCRSFRESKILWPLTVKRRLSRPELDVPSRLAERSSMCKISSRVRFGRVKCDYNGPNLRRIRARLGNAL
jgi:hypothetical protein